MSTALSLLIGTGGLFEFDATLPFFVILFITWVYLLTELVYTPLAENIEAEIEKTLEYQLYLREWFSLLEKKSLPLKLWKDKNLASRSLGLGDFGWVNNQETSSTDKDVNFFYLNLFFQSLGVDSSWRFESDRQASMIKQDPRSFLDLVVPDLISDVSIEERRLMIQKLVVGRPLEELMKGQGPTTDKYFFVVLAHKPSSPGTWDFAKKYHFMVGFPQADSLIMTLLGADAQGIIQLYTIVNWLIKAFAEQEGYQPEFVYRSLGSKGLQRLLEAAKQAKIDLSLLPESKINLPSLSLESGEVGDLCVVLTREKLQKSPKFRSDSLQKVERRLREELKGFGGGKTKFNPITGMTIADMDGGVPRSASQHCWVKPETDATTNEPPMEDGSIERSKALRLKWSGVWSQIICVAISNSIAPSVGRDIVKQFNFEDTSQDKVLKVSAPLLPGSFQVGFPETMKVEIDETIGSQLLVSEVIAAVPCDLKGIGIPQELESGLPGFIAHDLSDKTKEFAYLTILFLGICPAQAIYRGSVLLGLGVDLEGQLYNDIKDGLSGFTEDKWWRYLLGMCRGTTRKSIYLASEEAKASTVNKSIDEARERFGLPKEDEAKGSGQILRQALEYEMSEVLECMKTCWMVKKEEGEAVMDAGSIFHGRKWSKSYKDFSMTDLYTKMVDDKWDAAVFEVPEDPHNPLVYFAVPGISARTELSTENAWRNPPRIGTNLVVYTGSANLLALFSERVALWMPRLLQKSKGFLMFKVVGLLPTRLSTEVGSYWFQGAYIRAVALNGVEGLERGLRGVRDHLGKIQECHLGDLTVLSTGLDGLVKPDGMMMLVASAKTRKPVFREFQFGKPVLRVVSGGSTEVIVEDGRLKGKNTVRGPSHGKTNLLSFAKPVKQDEIDHCISRIEVPIKFIPKKERFSRFLQEYVSAVTAIFTAENDRRFYWYWYIRSTVEKSYLYHISQIRYRLCKKIVNVWVKLRICLVMVYDELRLRQKN